MDKDHLQIKTNISWAIIVTISSVLITIGTFTGNFFALEKRVSNLEQKQEQIFTTLKSIEIANSRIESTLLYIKEQIKAFHGQ